MKANKSRWFIYSKSVQSHWMHTFLHNHMEHSSFQQLHKNRICRHGNLPRRKFTVSSLDRFQISRPESLLKMKKHYQMSALSSLLLEMTSLTLSWIQNPIMTHLGHARSTPIIKWFKSMTCFLKILHIFSYLPTYLYFLLPLKTVPLLPISSVMGSLILLLYYRQILGYLINS